MGIEPDTKDWTWVLGRPCPECGLDVRAVPAAELGERLLANAAAWAERLGDGDTVRRRPDAGTWSVLEYGAHVRDVHRVMSRRLRLMLEQDDPGFDDWDQDAAAVAEHYERQEPRVVAEELVDAARTGAGLLSTVDGATWARSGRRSNGSEFTVESLGRYWLHDVHHHLHDVTA